MATVPSHTPPRAAKATSPSSTAPLTGRITPRGTVEHPVTVKAGTALYARPEQRVEQSRYAFERIQLHAVPRELHRRATEALRRCPDRRTIHLSATIDGHSIPEAVLFNHRETAPIFSYTLPATNNIDQVFFGEDISGRVSPVAADGYYMMLRPLSPGLHTIVFGGQTSISRHPAAARTIRRSDHLRHQGARRPWRRPRS